MKVTIKTMDLGSKDLDVPEDVSGNRDPLLGNCSVYHVHKFFLVYSGKTQG